MPRWLVFIPLLIWGCACLAGEDEMVISTSGSGSGKTQNGAVTTATTAAASKRDPAELLKAIHTGNAKERADALKDLGASKLKPIPKEVSAELARSTLLDENEAVRKAGALAIQALDDKKVKEYVYSVAVHPAVADERHLNAADAIRWMDDPTVIGWMVETVTSEISAGVAKELTPPAVVTIGGAFNLPIQLPNIELQSVRGVIATRAYSALTRIAGRDVGAPAGWRKWFEDYQRLREIRLREETKTTK